jgi:hypothetical protein
VAYTDPRKIIAELQLAPHPEGGHYREVHRSPVVVGTPPDYPGARVALTAIYFLLQRGEFSAFHRVRSEEAWVHLAGSPLELLLLGCAAGVLHLTPAGGGGAPLQVVPPGCWQAAHSAGAWTLVSCLVAPGFEFADFELADRAMLLAEYPDHQDRICRFARCTAVA